VNEKLNRMHVGAHVEGTASYEHSTIQAPCTPYKYKQHRELLRGPECTASTAARIPHSCSSPVKQLVSAALIFAFKRHIRRIFFFYLVELLRKRP
jgi:hypothetical protein